ncbi:hypothetical protein KEM52_006285 [Ascosphaera acerosa]|nr:hypothetical protein KEM52_006285 [Ascosphaera acerosa]
MQDIMAGSSPDLSMFGDQLDTNTFEQILEMDDDATRDFSRGIIFGFFEQAEGTFTQIQTALVRWGREARDLPKISALGHFLKGSSATLGLTKVEEACAKVQNLGARRDETGAVAEGDDEVSLRKIRATLEEARHDYQEIVALLKQFYAADCT